MIGDKDRDAKLAARRLREKKSRDRLDHSYVRKLVRTMIPGADSLKQFSQLVELKRAVLMLQRVSNGRSNPEMEAVLNAFTQERKRMGSSKTKLKA